MLASKSFGKITLNSEIMKDDLDNCRFVCTAQKRRNELDLWICTIHDHFDEQCAIVI